MYILNLKLFSLGKGDPESFLPLFHFILLDAFPLLADYFASKGYNLYGKKDSRFIECVYKLLRDEFTYKPAITKEQFFSLGFSERKIILTCDIIDMCLELNKKLIRVEYNKGYTTSTRKSQMAVNSKKKLGIKNGHSALNYYCEYSPEKENFQNPINIPTSYEYSSDPKRGKIKKKTFILLILIIHFLFILLYLISIFFFFFFFFFFFLIMLIL